MPLQEYYNTDDDGALSIYTGNIPYQTFIPDSTFTCNKIRMKLYRPGAGGSHVMTISIRATSAGEPVGPNLATATFAENQVVETAPPGAWYDIFLDTPFVLTGSTQYAIVVTTTNTNSTFCMKWRGDSTSPTYADGNAGYSDDGEATWTPVGWDQMFEIWDISSTDYPGPSLTRIEAIDEMCTAFKTAWDAEQDPDRVKYDNVGNTSTPPSGQDPWARVVIRHATSAQASLAGTIGSRRFRRTGLITVQVMEPCGQGLSATTDLPKIIQDAFEGVSTPGGVWFKDVAINEVGSDGDFFQTNVVAFFEYDEIK